MTATKITKLFSGKKGIEKEMLVILVVALAFIIANIFINRNIAEAGKHSFGVTACKASVDMNAKLRINGVEFPTEINCPASKIVIDKVEGDEREKEKANKLIADSMYYCWGQYGEGKLNLFKDEATFCAVCSFIDVQSDKPLTGLGSYLIGNEIPDGSGILYADYLGGHSTPRAKDIVGEMAESMPGYLTEAEKLELKPKSLYAVVFVYAKGRDEIKVVANNLFARTTAGEAALKGSLVFGAFAGAGTFAGLVTIGVATGPIGWIALGVGATAFGAAQVFSYFASPDNYPEWFSFLVLREWNADRTADILKRELGCDYFPVKIE
ncbi:hypothetical protein HYV85_03045 [Candidatus Woesearchaeota archaeon]|nr:hypothetical protein [Candidatus Woesearchaeota archaeon]